jgi:hypothetical protein
MPIYHINPIAGGNGFKVHVADEAGGLRVVGVFLTETDAEAWITTDRRRPEPGGCCAPREPAPQT